MHFHLSQANYLNIMTPILITSRWAPRYKAPHPSSTFQANLGTVSEYDNMRSEASKLWTSTRSFSRWPRTKDPSARHTTNYLGECAVNERRASIAPAHRLTPALARFLMLFPPMGLRGRDATSEVTEVAICTHLAVSLPARDSCIPDPRLFQVSRARGTKKSYESVPDSLELRKYWSFFSDSNDQNVMSLNVFTYYKIDTGHTCMFFIRVRCVCHCQTRTSPEQN